MIGAKCHALPSLLCPLQPFGSVQGRAWTPLPSSTGPKTGSPTSHRNPSR
jgi:hypothetical protein